jgi:ketosteroid isomerase-like protein
MDRRTFILLAACGAISAHATAQTVQTPSQLADGLRAAETAFAKTMADRDLRAFSEFIADDAVFINGGRPLRGKSAIVDYWKRFYSSAGPPFSWKPELVEVLDSGGLGYTEGPVTAPTGAVFGRFYSTWRREPTGQWKVVFDNGYDVCKCPKP